MNILYFDYAAATPLSDTALAAMQPYFSEQFYNPSALYIASQNVGHAIYSVRTEVASLLGCRPTEVVFTAGGTEANNLAIQGVMQHFAGKNCVVSAIEHDSVLAPAGNYDHKIAPVDPDGRINLTRLEQLIDDDTVLISIMYANNEIGTIQPLRDIAALVKKIRAERANQSGAGRQLPLYVHTDACQAANYLPLLVNSLGVDLMTLNGGKIYGPKQSGILYVKSGVLLKPQILGGGQERGWRSGTENVPAIAGFGAALAEAQSLRTAEAERLQALQADFFDKLTSIRSDIRINGSRSHRLPNNVHITIPGADNERLLMELDERGMMVATGSACSASSDEPSHVLGAIGLPDEAARSSLRITFGRQTDQAAVSALLKALASVLR